jgi:hypothetical protein
MVEGYSLFLLSQKNGGSTLLFISKNASYKALWILY